MLGCSQEPQFSFFECPSTSNFLSKFTEGLTTEKIEDFEVLVSSPNVVLFPFQSCWVCTIFFQKVFLELTCFPYKLCFLKPPFPYCLISNSLNFKLSHRDDGAHSMRLGPNFHSGMKFLKNLNFFHSWWPVSTFTVVRDRVWKIFLRFSAACMVFSTMFKLRRNFYFIPNAKYGQYSVQRVPQELCATKTRFCYNSSN